MQTMLDAYSFFIFKNSNANKYVQIHVCTTLYLLFQPVPTKARTPLPNLPTPNSSNKKKLLVWRHQKNSCIYYLFEVLRFSLFLYLVVIKNLFVKQICFLHQTTNLQILWYINKTQSTLNDYSTVNQGSVFLGPLWKVDSSVVT